MKFFHIYKVEIYGEIKNILYMGSLQRFTQFLDIDKYDSDSDSDFQSLAPKEDIKIIEEIEMKKYLYLKLFLFRYIFNFYKEE